MSQQASDSNSPPYDHGVSPEHAQGPPRKKMRKGTKSCLECRRRKIKCTFETGKSAMCKECYARGSTCIDQEHGDIQAYTQQTNEQSSYSLRERVTQLEDLLKQVLHRLPEKSDGTSGSNEAHIDNQTAEAINNLKIVVPTDSEESMLMPNDNNAPTLTLFDNEVITRKKNIERGISRAQYNKSKSIIQALNQLLPSPEDLNAILDGTEEWWAIWRRVLPQIGGAHCQSMKEAVSYSLRSDSPAEVAKIVLCLAVSIHQLPNDFNWSRLQLNEERSSVMEKYIEVVDQLVTSDDQIAATVDGIECILLEAKFQINMGRPRRAWILNHRAIAFAQLLGLHRLASQPDKSTPAYKRQYSLWCHLLMGDRFLSLFLGLPYSVADAFCAPYIPPNGNFYEEANEGERYVARMIPLITKMVDRNQSVTQMGYSATLRLDQELEELHDSADRSWWTTEKHPDQSMEDFFAQLYAQFVHHQTKLLLHMPFMLRSSTDKRYQYSHSAALDGAREVIKHFEAFRTNKTVGPLVCKFVDFQAFTAAMLLLLNLCGYSVHNRTQSAQASDLEQDQLDSALIDLSISLLHDSSKEIGGVVAAQSVQALEMLAKIRQGCEGEEIPEHCEGDSCQVSIPYFGTITIAMGKHFVPIKPGTYPRPGETRSIKAAITNSGLPTPPSLTSNSTQPSPMSSTIDGSQHQYPLSRRTPHFESSEYIAPGLESPWQTDDPLITFNSFMSLPPTQPTDFPYPGYTPQSYHSANTTPQTDPSHGNMGMGNMNNHSYGNSNIKPTNEFPFNSWPFSPQQQQQQENIDLDQGWNWFGIDAPVMQ